MTRNPPKHKLEQALPQPSYTVEGQTIPVHIEPSGETPDLSAMPANRQTLYLARLISLIGHPFLIAPLAIVLLIWLDQGNLRAALGWAGVCAAFVVLPGTVYLRHKLKRQVYSDADVSVREHRYGYYLFGLACMILCFAVLIWFQAPAVLLAGFTAALAALTAAALTNRLWTKVSIHTGTIAGAATAAAFFSLPLAAAFGLGMIAVGWARLKTGRHTLEQAVLGALIATVCVSAVLGLWLYLRLI